MIEELRKTTRAMNNLGHELMPLVAALCFTLWLMSLTAVGVTHTVLYIQALLAAG